MAKTDEKSEELTDEHLAKMYSSAVFLDEPACGVVRQLIEEIRRQRSILRRNAAVFGVEGA